MVAVERSDLGHLLADEHPDSCHEIAQRAVHEVGYHGYYHESVLEIPIAEERELMKRGIAKLEETFAAAPRATVRRRSLWAEHRRSARRIRLRVRLEPFRSRRALPTRVPLVGGRLRDFVELPVSWELDDAPYFLFSFFPYMSGMATPVQVLEIWKAEFEGSYRGRRVLPPRRPPLLHRSPPAHRHARRADPLDQGLPRRLVSPPPRRRPGMAPDPGRGGSLGRPVDGPAPGRALQAFLFNY
jgi:peptidoglycan/xylan/chitin deacetylase (PgdA/CDA1 family)